NGVRVLRGYSDKYGLLIRGPAGVGKSCLAGKLIERFPNKELVVFHGELKKANILRKLRQLFDKKGVEAGLRVIKSELEYEDRIKELFRSVFKQLRTLIYFDDFEQNLDRKGDDYWVKPEVIETIKPILYALEWSEGQTNLMITSRYPFIMEVEGENLPAKYLEDLTLMSCKGADLEKKKNELLNISKSKHSQLYLEFGKGNPRLLEWLDKIAEEEEKYNLKQLKQALQGKNEDYIREYLAEILAKTEGEDFLQFLRRAAVFRLPVQQSAFEKFGDKEFLDKGVNLTLFEREKPSGLEPVYWVAPIIREAEWRKLPKKEKLTMHDSAFKWYDKKITESKEPNFAYLNEAVLHALESNRVLGACKHAIPLGDYLSDLLLYQEQFILQQRIIDRISNHVVSEAIEKKDPSVANLYNNFGSLCQDLGDAKKAVQYFEKALEIDLNIFGDKHPKVVEKYYIMGEICKSSGDKNKAIKYYEKTVEIVKTVLGNNHPFTQEVQKKLDELKE
ncbi:MAG: tetratricopeptide repeat protein, partial [bacterium]